MSKSLLIKAKKRENKKPNALRQEGFVPATLYGHNIKSISIQVNAKDFSKVSHKAYSHINKLEIEGEEETHDILIKNVHLDPIKDTFQNIEFYEITKGEKVKIKIALKFVGQSPAVGKGGVLIISHNEIEIQCLPKDIPDEIEANLDLIQEIGQSLHIKDLKLPEGVQTPVNPLEILAKVETPKTHTVEEKAPEATATAEVKPATAEVAKSEAKKEEKK